MTTREVRRRPGGRSAQVRSAVLAATLEVLSETGPSDFTIADVAKRAGVHETSVYRRWGSRERLALEAMSELSSELIPVPDTGSLREDLAALGHELVDYVGSPLGLALTRAMAVSVDDDEAAEARSRFWHARFTECTQIVDRAVARGDLPTKIDGRLLLEVFVAPIHFRLLLTREPVTTEFIGLLADVAISSARASRPG